MKMNKPILILTLAGFMLGSVITSCHQSSSTKIDNKEDKLLKEQEDVVEAKQDLNQALKDSVRQFKLDAQNTITENNRKIDEFKQKIASGKKETRDKYEVKVNDLERKNKELQKRLDEFNDENGEKWTSFKREFNHDMDEMGNSLKDLTENNVD
jgi:DNA anti-recombination protein RmuC